MPSSSPSLVICCKRCRNCDDLLSPNFSSCGSCDYFFCQLLFSCKNFLHKLSFSFFMLLPDLFLLLFFFSFFYYFFSNGGGGSFEFLFVQFPEAAYSHSPVKADSLLLSFTSFSPLRSAPIYSQKAAQSKKTTPATSSQETLPSRPKKTKSMKEATPSTSSQKQSSQPSTPLSKDTSTCKTPTIEKVTPSISHAQIPSSHSSTPLSRDPSPFRQNFTPCPSLSSSPLKPPLNIPQGGAFNLCARPHPPWRCSPSLAAASVGGGPERWRAIALSLPVPVSTEASLRGRLLSGFRRTGWVPVFRPFLGPVG
ncbi:unnamed protein product [Acanthosepion pharaonis]|uniref:Uncharacterized protein n=1 Tax=Acanthosepion pharaonis TaxID=158019 RepID=A0A812BI97_ACAPH|nr:unnamed protein product [Sepia pharaonis]